MLAMKVFPLLPTTLGKVNLTELYKRKNTTIIKDYSVLSKNIQLFREHSFALCFDFCNFFCRCGYNP
jgi:hypothetical protein